MSFLDNLFNRAPDPTRVHGAKARELVQSGALLLDVRTPSEFASGHLSGAVNIPVDQLQRRLDELPTGKPIVVYCRSGARSARAVGILSASGIKPAYDLGSIANW